MNGRTLPIKHGAPLRLGLETQVGFKMCKWIERIEFISDYSNIGRARAARAKTTGTTRGRELVADLREEVCSMAALLGWE